MTRVRRALYPLTAALILGYFLFFSLRSLDLYFDADDMYALYFAWSKPLLQVVRENLYLWKGEFRPFGAFFYRGIFAVAGFDPLPFRIAALTVCALDTVLCFWFTRLISGSERTAALATLLFAFQVRMLEVWFRTTVIFDTLCFTFVCIAAVLYIKARREGGDLTGWRIAPILFLFFLALNSKEFAVALPVFLVAWEVLFNSARLKTFLRSRAAMMIAGLGVLTLIYTIGKLNAAAAMVTNPFYTPEYSYTRFTDTWGEYMKDLFVLNDRPPGRVSMPLLAGMLALAAAMRSRLLTFAWVILFFGMLPASFAPPRGGYEIYLSYLGWVLYASALVVALQDLATRHAPQARTALACVVFVLVGWRYGKLQLHSLRTEDHSWLYEPPAAVHAMADQLLAMHPTLPAGSRLLFLEDGFTTSEWTPMFVLRLLYEDPRLIVDRTKLKTEKPADWKQHMAPPNAAYDYVFNYENGRYVQVQPALASLPAHVDKGDLK